MRAMVLVAVTPVLGHAADLVQAGEHIAIEHLGAESAVEALDVRILGRLPGLDVEQLDAVPVRPGLERGTDELGTVVEPEPPRCALHPDQFIECPKDASAAAIPPARRTRLPLVAPPIPRLRQVSTTFAPASTSLRMRAICSSVKRDFFMQSSSGWSSTSNWIEFTRTLHWLYLRTHQSGAKNRSYIVDSDAPNNSFKPTSLCDAA
jgi:hypothetical protein